MKLKRVFAYFIDLVIVLALSTIIFMFMKDDYKAYEEASMDYTKAILEIGSGVLDEDTELDLIYNLNITSQPQSIITCGLLFAYFGIFAYLNKGRTLGKMMFKLKVENVENKKINPNLFILRAVLVTNLIPRIASIIVLATLSKENWLIAQTIIGYISDILLFLMLGFIIFRDDERGFHDLICQTKVTEKESK